MTPEALRKKLLAAVLPHVAFDGWSESALRAAARDLEIEPVLAFNAFPGGPADLIEAFSAAAVRLRLEQVAPQREAVGRGLAFLALPQNAPLGLRCLYRTVDAIWYAAGDRSTDYNFYTKRLLLAGVYSSTLLFWLNDKSDGYAATWAFLDRRIAEVLKIAGRMGKTVKSALDLPDRLARRFGATRR